MIHRLSNLHVDCERLLIRPAIDADLKEIYPIHINPQVNKYLPYDTWQSWHDAKHWYAYVQERRAKGIAEQFVIATPNGIIGTCIAFNYVPSIRGVEFGYVLNQQFWGKGLMSEAMRAFIPALQDSLQLSQINANVEAGNTSSLRLLDSLGFKHLGTIIEDDNTELQKLVLCFSDH